MTGIDHSSSPRDTLVLGARRLLGIIALIGAVCTGIAAITIPTRTSAAAHAQPCPDIEVIFARGTFEPPGVGITGQSFIDALQHRLGDTTVEVYPVDYPASLDFTNGAGQGVVDASNKVTDVATQCPHTQIITGGYSQGAAVAAYLTAESVPANYPLPDGITGPLPPDTARHIAAVALFGKPCTGFLNFLVHDAPPITIGHLYTDKTIELCVPEDPVCSPTGHDQGAHNTYAGNGMTDQAADFAAHATTGHA
ncbi:MAG: cutinase family protein [Mycobacterium sp.]|nr:cutinase family protein [Mycobacterium sp.]